jgi:hypothetical protein
MSNILFIDCFTLLKVWAIGFFGLHLSGMIHILPVIAIIAFLLGLFYKRALLKQSKL